MLYQSYFRGEYVFMEKDGRTRMLLVSLLGNKRLETSGSAILGRLFPGSEREAAPDLDERNQQ
jgi:hypothetical protein